MGFSLLKSTAAAWVIAITASAGALADDFSVYTPLAAATQALALDARSLNDQAQSRSRFGDPREQDALATLTGLAQDAEQLDQLARGGYADTSAEKDSLGIIQQDFQRARQTFGSIQNAYDLTYLLDRVGNDIQQVNNAIYQNTPNYPGQSGNPIVIAMNLESRARLAEQTAQREARNLQGPPRRNPPLPGPYPVPFPAPYPPRRPGQPNPPARPGYPIPGYSHSDYPSPGYPMPNYPANRGFSNPSLPRALQSIHFVLNATMTVRQDVTQNYADRNQILNDLYAVQNAVSEALWSARDAGFSYQVTAALNEVNRLAIEFQSILNGQIIGIPTDDGGTWTAPGAPNGGVPLIVVR